MLLQKGRPAEAIAHLQRSVELEPPRDGDIYSNLASAYLGLGRIDEAIAECRKALAIDPDNVGGYNNYGIALVHKGQIDAALRCFQKAVEIKVDYVDARYNFGNALLQQGRRRRPLRSSRRSCDCTGLLAARKRLGNALVLAGAWTRRRRSTQESWRSVPTTRRREAS